jgi:type II secretory pathway pseudopilin PulG
MMTSQTMLGLMIRRQPLAWRRLALLPIHTMDRSKGFSLVELLIVAGITAVVLAGLGALTLISDVRVGRRNDSIQEAQEQWGRAVTFIQSEVADAASLSKTPSTTYPSDCGVEPNPILELKGPPNDPPDPSDPTKPAWTVFYGVRAIADSEKGLYRGPKLLIRCGPLPLAADPDPTNPEVTAIYGNIDKTKVNTPTKTILLDRLPADNPLQVLLLANPDNGPVQDAQLTITMKAGTEKDGTVITFAGDQPFRVHAQRSPRTP